MLFDTADESISRQYIENVVHALNGRPLDYMVVQHMEPDHCAMIDDMLRRYPEAKMVCSAKAVGMFAQFYGTDVAARALVVKEGDKLSTGEHTLHFVMAPMVHWPEVMVTYDEKDKILFSADAFGIGALAGNIFNDEITFDTTWMNDARRYYTNIVGKYGVQVQALLKKAASLDIEMIRLRHIISDLAQGSRPAGYSTRREHATSRRTNGRDRDATSVRQTLRTPQTCSQVCWLTRA